MTAVDEAFSEYRTKYPARPPDLTRMRYEDELREIAKEEGLRELTIAPALDDVRRGMPPTSSETSDPNKYLWAVEVDRLPFALEDLSDVSLQRGRLAHTNLTGGRNAHASGEVWFVDVDAIIINGGSSRYPPRSSEELGAIASSFKACGYKVASMGWDDGINGPARLLRGSPEWI